MCKEYKGCGEYCDHPNRWLYDTFYPEEDWPGCHSYTPNALKRRWKKLEKVVSTPQRISP